MEKKKVKHPERLKHIECPKCGKFIDESTTIPCTKKEVHVIYDWELPNYARCPLCGAIISLGQANCVGDVLEDSWNDDFYEKALKYVNED